jgi:hypothetical protein
MARRAIPLAAHGTEKVRRRREHGDALTQIRRPTATRIRWARPRLVVGTGLGLARAAGVLALALGATSTSPAFAVTRNHDGTVTISIKRSSGIAGANAKLRQLGIGQA